MVMGQTGVRRQDSRRVASGAAFEADSRYPEVSALGARYELW